MIKKHCFCKKNIILLNQEDRMATLTKNINLLSEYIELNSALKKNSAFPFWIKDKKFRFKVSNQAMLDKFYNGAKEEDLYNKTDWEYAKSIGCDKKLVEDMKNCCSFSDNLILNSELESAIFLERFQTTDGKIMWLQTSKTRIPPISTSKTCLGICGTAIEITDETAKILINNPKLKIKKLSDTCYLWEM